MPYFHLAGVSTSTYHFFVEADSLEEAELEAMDNVEKYEVPANLKDGEWEVIDLGEEPLDTIDF